MFIYVDFNVGLYLIYKIKSMVPFSNVKGVVTIFIRFLYDPFFNFFSRILISYEMDKMDKDNPMFYFTS